MCFCTAIAVKMKLWWARSRPIATCLKVGPSEWENGYTRIDLSVTMCESEDGLRARFGYNTDLFDESTISRMTEHFQRLLQGVIENPERPISQLPLLTESEKRKILIEWNRTAASYPDVGVQQLIERQAERPRRD